MGNEPFSLLVVGGDDQTFEIFANGFRRGCLYSCLTLEFYRFSASQGKGSNYYPKEKH